MEIKNKDIRELSGPDQTMITGGDYVESSLGVIAGLAFGAGVLASAPLLGAAVVVGGAYLLYGSL